MEDPFYKASMGFLFCLWFLWQMALNRQKQKLPAPKMGTKVGTPDKKVGTAQKVGTRPETAAPGGFSFYFLLSLYHYPAAFLTETYAIFSDNHIPCIIMFIFSLLKRVLAHAFHFRKPLYMFKFKYYSRLLFIIRL